MEVYCEARVGAALLFIGTNRMLGRVTASQIASASVVSFLPRLRKAFTARRHQPDLVPKRDQFAHPIVRSRAPRY